MLGKKQSSLLVLYLQLPPIYCAYRGVDPQANTHILMDSLRGHDGFITQSVGLEVEKAVVAQLKTIIKR